MQVYQWGPILDTAVTSTSLQFCPSVPAPNYQANQPTYYPQNKQLPCTWFKSLSLRKLYARSIRSRAAILADQFFGVWPRLAPATLFLWKALKASGKKLYVAHLWQWNQKEKRTVATKVNKYLRMVCMFACVCKHIYILVCVHIYILVCACIYTNMCSYIHTSVCAYIHTNVCSNILACVHIYILLWIYILYIYILMCICISICVHTYIHIVCTYVHIYTDVYIYTHTSVYVHIYIVMCIDIYMHIGMYAYIHTSMCIYTY